jgi:uncharacterized BrkB/YihY/UPF0761 family membrane protein
VGAATRSFPHRPWGVEAIHVFTIYWVARQITRKSELYGAIGGSLAILLWAYVIGRLVILGAVINSLLWERHEASPVAKTATGPTSQAGRSQADSAEL